MNFMRLNGEPPAIIDAVAVEVETRPPPPPPWPQPSTGGEIASLGARLSELLAQETPNELLTRLGDFKRSVANALQRSSSAYQLLRQLEDNGLKDCARCTAELEERLASNPHYVVLGKIAEAEKLVSALAGPRF
jgi:hypothetical protein